MGGVIRGRVRQVHFPRSSGWDHFIESFGGEANDDGRGDAGEVGKTWDGASAEQEGSTLCGHVRVEESFEKVFMRVDHGEAVGSAGEAQTNRATKHGYSVVLDFHS